MIGVFAAGLWLDRDRLRSLGASFSLADTRILPALAAWTDGPGPPDHVRVALFGDSVLECEKGSTKLGPMLSETLDAHGVPNALVTVGQTALRPVHFYYFLDRVLAARPQLAVIEVNVVAFSPWWIEGRYLGFREQSRLLSPGRSLRARRALDAERVSLLDPAIYRLEERLGVLYVMEGLRRTWEGRLATWGLTVSAAMGVPEARPAVHPLGVADLDSAEARLFYGNDLAGAPTAGALRLLLEDLRAAGVATLLFVTPLPVDRFAELGLADELALPARLARLRAAVGAAPGEWLDLHDMLPSDAFGDYRAHLHPDACRRVAGRLVDALATRVGRASAAVPAGD